MNRDASLPEEIAPFARRFFEYVRRQQPELLDQGKFAHRNGQWCFQLHDERTGEGNCIWVFVDAEEVTVGLGEFAHHHFPMFDDGRKEQDHFDDAIKMIGDFQEERLAVVKGRIGYSICTSDAALEKWQKNPSKVETRSFHGTYDRHRVT